MFHKQGCRAIVKKLKFKIKYKLGDVVAVPLAVGGYMLEVIARGSLRSYTGGGVIAYIFSKRYMKLPDKVNYKSLLPLKARTFFIHSDLEIRAKNWPIIGQVPDFDPNLWIMPHFHRLVIRPEYDYMKSQAIVYSGKNIFENTNSYDVAPDIGLAPDGVCGYEFFTLALEDIVKQKNKYPTHILRPPGDPELQYVIEHYEKQGDKKCSSK